MVAKHCHHYYIEGLLSFSDYCVWRPLPKLPDHIAKTLKENSYDNTCTSPRQSSTSPKISRSKKLLQRQKKMPLEIGEKTDNVVSEKSDGGVIIFF
jgi:hypothetical protein